MLGVKSRLYLSIIGGGMDGQAGLCAAVHPLYHGLPQPAALWPAASTIQAPYIGRRKTLLGNHNAELTPKTARGYINHPRRFGLCEGEFND